MIDSLRDNGDDSPLWVLAMDDATVDFVRGQSGNNVHLITVDQLELSEPALAPLRAVRSTMEYYFTCTPIVIRYAMNRYVGDANIVVYLDADLYYFADPNIAIDAIGNGSVAIIPHRYPDQLERRLRKYGKYNAGWIAFRSDAAGIACLEWYAKSCIDWCSDTPEDGKYADQGYLNEFHDKFQGVVTLQDAGLNLAPWNTGRHSLTAPAGGVVVDSSFPLVFFHFHGIRRVGSWWVTSQLIYQAPMSKLLRAAVYRPYLAHLDQVERNLADQGLVPKRRAAKRGTGLRGLVSRMWKALVDFLTILSGNAIKAYGERD